MTQNSRIALVTGGAGGIGVAICRQLAAAGHRVAVTDLDLSAARDVAAGLPPHPDGHAAFALDVSNEASVVTTFDAITAQLGRPEILVHSAGILHFKPDGDRPLVVETSLADWKRNVDINQTGCFLVCREYARRLPDTPTFGRVVTLSSVAAQLGGYRSNAAYIAT
jgi:3-oxoacyl-[acyl-carrier protein] reductase